MAKQQCQIACCSPRHFSEQEESLFRRLHPRLNLTNGREWKRYRDMKIHHDSNESLPSQLQRSTEIGYIISWIWSTSILRTCTWDSSPMLKIVKSERSSGLQNDLVFRKWQVLSSLLVLFVPFLPIFVWNNGSGSHRDTRGICMQLSSRHLRWSALKRDRSRSRSMYPSTSASSPSDNLCSLWRPWKELPCHWHYLVRDEMDEISSPHKSLPTQHKIFADQETHPSSSHSKTMLTRGSSSLCTIVSPLP